ncbi:HAMP domain-containing histidine kinase [Flavobacteriaceae bacterium]|nr:HAMP domain-containing histidine kinase [Flavobacteriaceae bacterium]
MNKRKVYIGILVVSVVGFFVVQYQYLNIGLNLARVQFQKNISKAAQSIKEDLSTQNQLTFLIGQAITLDEGYFTLSMDSIQDASRHFLNDFITYRLAEQGIDTDFTYRLSTKDSTDYLSSTLTAEPAAENDKRLSYPIELKGYLPELITKSLLLELQFRDLNRYFLFQLNGLIIPSLLFMAGILVVIVWVLRSFYWQSRIITTTNDFINNLTHELKTPVFSIGLATKILQKKVPESEQSVVELIQQETDRMKTHIDKVLELSRLESGRKPYALNLIDFKPELETLMERYEKLADLEGFKFDYALPDHPIIVQVDSAHWINALNNLWDNARRYANNPEIHFSAQRQDKYWVFSISDNGPGMSPEQQERMFDKYYRGGQEDTHRVKGYGLGLSYVQHIVRGHKGRIKVDSTLGKGTTISLSLMAYER